MSNCLKIVDKLTPLRTMSKTYPLFPVVSGDGLHGALEFESKLAESPGTLLLGLDPGLGRL